MITLEQHFFEASDGKRIFYHTTPVVDETRGIVLIIHGMAEYGRRYQYFADQLYQKHYAAVMIDLRGHGVTGEEEGSLGHFADENGWTLMIEDIHHLTLLIQKAHPELPIILFGHSMGSVAARCCLIQFGKLYQKAIICGTTTGVNPIVLAAGRFLANYEIKHYGASHPSTTLAEMSFGGYNKKFVPNRTAFDWLSANEANVDAYMQDPLCGFFCTSTFYRDLFTGIAFAGKGQNIARMPENLPILLIAGACDPVGSMGKEVTGLYQKMQRAGLKKIQLTLVPGKRHEILNESDRDETIGIMTDFLK